MLEHGGREHSLWAWGQAGVRTRLSPSEPFPYLESGHSRRAAGRPVSAVRHRSWVQVPAGESAGTGELGGPPVPRPSPCPGPCGLHPALQPPPDPRAPGLSGEPQGCQASPAQGRPGSGCSWGRGTGGSWVRGGGAGQAWRWGRWEGETQSDGGVAGTDPGGGGGSSGAGAAPCRTLLSLGRFPGETGLMPAL